MSICRISTLEGIDMDHISCLRDEADRFDLTIYDSTFKPQSDIRMDRKCEIQHRTSDRQLNHISLWSIQKDTLIQYFDIQLVFKSFFIFRRLVIVYDIL